MMLPPSTSLTQQRHRLRRSKYLQGLRRILQVTVKNDPKRSQVRRLRRAVREALEDATTTGTERAQTIKAVLSDQMWQGEGEWERSCAADGRRGGGDGAAALALGVLSEVVRTVSRIGSRREKMQCVSTLIANGFYFSAICCTFTDKTVSKVERAKACHACIGRGCQWVSFGRGGKMITTISLPPRSAVAREKYQ